MRLLALSILTCSPNMSFLVRLVLGNHKFAKKFQLGHYPQPPLRKNFSTGAEVLFIATFATDLIFLSPLISEI